MKRFLTSIFCVALLLLLFTSVTANEPEASNELIERIDKSYSFTLLNQESERKVIKCFDVNANGWFAVGFRGNIVHVYDENGTFQYGYRFDSQGNYGLGFNGSNLVIYIVRGSVAVELDSEGNRVSAKELTSPEMKEQNILDRKEKKIGLVTYCVERDIGIFDEDYSRLVAIDDTGSQRILYDVTIRGYFVGGLHYIVIFGFAFGVIAVVVSLVKKGWNGEDDTASDSAKA